MIQGFTLESAALLSGLKLSNRKGTALHLMVHLLKTQRPEVVSLLKADLEPARKVVAFSVDYLAVEVNEMSASFASVQSMLSSLAEQIKAMPDDPPPAAEGEEGEEAAAAEGGEVVAAVRDADAAKAGGGEKEKLRAFAEAMEAFMAVAAEGVKSLGQALMDMQEAHKKLAALFAEDTAQLDAGGLYERLLAFADQLAASEKEARDVFISLLSPHPFPLLSFLPPPPPLFQPASPCLNRPDTLTDFWD